MKRHTLKMLLYESKVRAQLIIKQCAGGPLSRYQFCIPKLVADME